MGAQLGTPSNTTAAAAAATTARVIHEDTAQHPSAPVRTVEPAMRRLTRVIGRCFLEVPTSSWLLVDMVILLTAIWQGY